MELNKLPITLVMVVRNSGGRLKEVIENHRDIVSEVVVIDQSSTDGTYEEALKYADYVIKRTPKGYNEPDRNFAFQIGTQPWVLNLDDDENLTEESKKLLPEVLEYGADVIWIKRDNWFNGVSLADKIGPDPQCRLFRRGSLKWFDKAHTYPEKANNAVTFYSDLYIVHKRSFDQLVKAHAKRSRVLDENNVRAEEEYLGSIATELRKRGAL